MFVFIGYQEYLNVTMNAPLTVKINQNRFIWSYYIFKNLIFYGNQSSKSIISY